MLVINERAAMPRSEQRVLDWMRTWRGQYIIVGLAISGCHVPGRAGEDEAREVDLVVVTPRAIVVIEVEGTVPDATSGVLSVRANGSWRLSGFEGDPIHVRDNDTSPFDQVGDNVSALRELVREHQPDAYVDGLIVVVPPWESTITLEVESRQHGCGVVLGSTPGELRAWLHRTSNRKLLWTAEAVHALLADLELGHLVTVEELLAEGFPSATGKRAKAVALEDAEGSGRESAYPSHLSGPMRRRAAAGDDAEPAREAVPYAPVPISESAETDDGADAFEYYGDASTPEREPVAVGADPTPAPESPSWEKSVAARSDASEVVAATAEYPEQHRVSVGPAPDYRRVRLERPARAMSADAATDPSPWTNDPVSRVLSYSSSAPEEPASRAATVLRNHPEAGDPDIAVVDPPPPGDEPFAPDVLSPAERRRAPESGGQRPHHSAPHRTDYDPPWIAADEDADRLRVTPQDYVRPPWIAPEDDAAQPVRPPYEPDPSDDEDDHLDDGPVLSLAPEYEDEEDPEVLYPPTSRSGSAFTDQWSSWVDPRYGPPSRPLRRPGASGVVVTPLPSRLPVTEREPEPDRPDWKAALRERLPSAIPIQLPSKLLTGNLPQQLGAVLVIGCTVGAVWLLASACNATYHDAVEHQRPAGNSEVVEPQGADKARPPTPFPTLPLCFPRPTNC